MTVMTRLAAVIAVVIVVSIAVMKVMTVFTLRIITREIEIVVMVPHSKNGNSDNYYDSGIY